MGGAPGAAGAGRGGGGCGGGETEELAEVGGWGERWRLGVGGEEEEGFHHLARGGREAMRRWELGRSGPRGRDGAGGRPSRQWRGISSSEALN
jgi:hypothetical protein